MDEEGERFDEGCGGATRTEKREVETRVAIGTELSRTRGAIEWRRFNGPMPARELDSDMMVKRGDDEDGTNVELGLVVLVEGVPRFGRGGLALRLISTKRWWTGQGQSLRHQSSRCTQG